MNSPFQAGTRSLLSAAQTSRLLQILFPPQAVILVGVSRSQPHLLDWPSVRPENILLVDAAPEALANTRKSLPKTTAWQMRSAVLADHAGEACFFTASNPGEDGLVPPQQLAELWPNLRTTAERTCTTQTLHALLAEPELAGLAEVDDTWLVIDCLPALRILRGAGALLQRCKVISLRVLLEPLEQEEPGTTLAEAERYLAEHHFRCIARTEENHPQIGTALFVRDDDALHKQTIASLQTTCDALNAKNAALLAERAVLDQNIEARSAEHARLQENYLNLSRERSDLAQQNVELTATCAAWEQKLKGLTTENEVQRQHQTRLAAEKSSLSEALATAVRERDLMKQQNSESTAKHEALKTEKNTLGTECEALREEQKKLINERNTLTQEKATLTSARDEQTKQANERQGRLDALTKEKAELAATCNKLTEQHNQQAKLVAERQAQLDRLGQDQAELVAAHETLEQETAALVAARDEQLNLASERQARIDSLIEEKKDLVSARDQLSAEHDRQADLASERQALLDALTREKAELLAVREALTRENEGLTSEYGSRINQLETELQDSHRRQRLMQEELVKGEAQIELIKDLLLHEEER